MWRIKNFDIIFIYFYILVLNIVFILLKINMVGILNLCVLYIKFMCIMLNVNLNLGCDNCFLVMIDD